MMDEDLQKRNTDCVYFLASPLTCKKGIECEYRHNDIARLNPRDCCYWLAGSCLNPTCGFRHPPLESFAETSYKSTTTCHQSVVPTNKTNVPCFFYHNGFCYKGERCVFLHGPEDGAIACQSSKIASAVSDRPAPEQKALKGSETVETQPISFEKTQVNLGQTTDNLTEGNCQGVSGSPSKETVAEELDYSLPDEGGSHLVNAWSSDDEEQWLESSPGFDVLVNDRPEELAYEEETDYSLQFNNERRNLVEQYVEYDFHDRIVFEDEPRDSYNGFQNERTGYFFIETNGNARSRETDHCPRSLGSSSLNSSSRNRRPHLHSARQHFKRRRRGKQLQPSLSQVSRTGGGSSGKRKPTGKFKVFSAPKTLSQIKEEKRAKGDACLGLRPSVVASVEDDFQGPKSLAEILKDKRR